LWAKSRLAVDPKLTHWQRDYAFTAPLLRFNTAMELLAACAVFMISRQWAHRDQLRRDVPNRWLRAEWLALLGFALAWFNPASFLSAHGRPTWDAWVAPFFLWAIWLCAKDRWFLAGCLIGIGTMFKGQQLVVAPVFLLWPLMGLRLGAIGRFVLGCALAGALIVSPWIVGPRPLPIGFVVAVSLLPVVAWLLVRYWKPSSKRFGFLPRRAKLGGSRTVEASPDAQASPLGSPHAASPESRSAEAVARSAFRPVLWLTAMFLTLALASCVPLFDGSMDWYRIAFVYGADKFTDLEIGGASSLAGILQHSWQWTVNSPVPICAIGSYTPTISHLLIAAFTLLILPCCWAMRRYERSGDARFVLAMAAPWIVYFAVFPKMHERYLLWGALAACCSTIVGAGPVLLAILFSILSTMMSIYQMLPRDRTDEFLTELSPRAGRMVYDFIRPTYPGIGWAVLLATAVWVWIACGPAFLAAIATIGPRARSCLCRFTRLVRRFRTASPASAPLPSNGSSSPPASDPDPPR